MTTEATEKSGKSSCCSPQREGAAASAPVKITLGQRQVDKDQIIDIPGGASLIGTDRPEIPLDMEQPLRKTRIKPFRMDATTVTNRQFEEFVQDTGYVTEAERLGDSFVFRKFLTEESGTGPKVPNAPWWKMIKGASWRAIFGPGSEDAWLPENPVLQVSWNDANAFAKWAGGRLPTENEWEHAARGGLGDVRFPWGDQEPNDIDFFPCNIWQGEFPYTNLGKDGYIGPAPAKSFEPNGYGLYNMVGNVWEWTCQPFKVRSLSKQVQRAHAEKVGYKLIKGGSYMCHASYCYRYRIAARSGTSPDSASCHQSFRLVYDAA